MIPTKDQLNSMGIVAEGLFILEKNYSIIKLSNKISF